MRSTIRYASWQTGTSSTIWSSPSIRGTYEKSMHPSRKRSSVIKDSRMGDSECTFGGKPETEKEFYDFCHYCERGLRNGHIEPPLQLFSNDHWNWVQVEFH
jgi:hypothetical protein